MSRTAFDPEEPYARLAVGGLIAREHAGRTCEWLWLLLRKAGDPECWDPPGGRLERGEDLAQGVRREVREETGLSVEVAGPCYAYLTFYKGERLLVVSMACHPAAGADVDAIRLEPGHSAWAWRTTAEWEALAAAGNSSWTSADVRRATRLATAIWEAAT